MTLFLFKDPSLENKLIGNILRKYPQTARTMERYFGRHCLERPGFKIKTLEIACILYGVDQNLLVQEFEKIQN
jgi:hypothetical protein